jgi:hypothetical protein
LYIPIITIFLFSFIFNSTLEGSILEDSKINQNNEHLFLNKQSEKILYDNNPPSIPSPPKGPANGEIGFEYEYSSNSKDLDGDDVYYLFDWGDGTNSSWIGEFESGSIVCVSHIWQEKGYYNVKVKAKDVFGLESEWSDTLFVEISGPYLTFGEIEGGKGLFVEIKNIGNRDASDIKIDIEASGGLKVILPRKQYNVEYLSINESKVVNLKVWGIGLGIITDFPTIKITVSGSLIKSRTKGIVARVFGPMVKYVGDFWSEEEAFEGYTLFSPVVSLKTYLINNSGEIVHQWKSNFKPALSVYLLEDSNLLRTAFPGFSPRFFGGGIGGRVEIIDWDDDLLWYFQYSTDKYCLHHDVEILPNGNILMIAWEHRSAVEAIEEGRDPGSLPWGEIWPDHIIEVEPNGSSGGDIVWEWHAWDHIIQDFDPSKNNYGVVKNHPELIDINYGSGGFFPDWHHINSIYYNEDFDQIILSVHNFDEIWIIDHSTTTEEAAGHTGGRYGKGGDLLYRWGNPEAYRCGDKEDKKLFKQHDARWIQTGVLGEGNILIFNNGLGRPGVDFSTVDEIKPPVDSSGNYNYTPGTAYGPEEPVWSYRAENPTDFYSINLAGSQRLPNGNTLICDGTHGNLFEVTNEKEKIWEYLNQFPNLFDNHVFKVNRYSPEYPGLKYLFD